MNYHIFLPIGQVRHHTRVMRGFGHYAFVLLTLLLIGCPQPAAYREPITRFQQASTVVIESARTDYGIANKGERNAEIDRRVAKGEKITLRDLNDEKLRLLGPDDLAARMAALDALAKHGQLLLTLASSDAPTKAHDAANSLDDAINGLSTALGHVPSDRFKSTAEGFATIAAEAAKLVLEVKISQALDKAITASEQSVKALIQLLRTEMAALYERRRTHLSAARVSATDEYNEALAKPSPSLSELQRAAAQIKKIEDEWDTLPLLLGAGPSLDAMGQAHQKLVDYAKSSKTPQDLAGLIEAIDAFVTRAKVIADAIKTIREAKD